MATIFYESDADLSALAELPIALIGYGNQGRAHALNLRESGLTVWVGSRPDSRARAAATADGFTPRTIPEAVENCPVLALMLPDEALPHVYQEHIEPYLRPFSTFVFAHGFTVRHNTIRLPEDADVLLVAPTGPGRQLRSLYEEGKGLPALIAVQQDASGLAWQRCLAYAHGIGSTRAGAIKTTFEEETITDLYCEQAVLCGGMPELIKAAFETLVERGYQPELAYISCLKEVKLIADLLFAAGIDGMRSAISNTAKYGSAVAGPKLVDARTVKELNDLLSDIESGAFARSFLADTRAGSQTVKLLMASERHSKLAKVGHELRDSLSF
ncbi:MAG TPA: ketol-acid reductoisomerase [Candidatus Obscuribacterales bacterium]